MGKITGILSLKGGVGKTSVVASLGDAMAGFNKKVLLVDGNLSAPNLGFHLNVINPERTLHDVLSRNCNVRDSICSLDKFDMIPAALSYNSSVNPLKLKDKIRGLKKSYDSILVDSSPRLDEETLGVMLASDSVLIVTTPDYPTLSTTIKAVNMAKKRGTKIDGLILNKVHGKNFELSLNEIENMTDSPVLAVVPHDVNVLKALSDFTPSTKYKPNSNTSKEYKKLAATLVGEKYKPFSFRKLLKWPKKEEINRELFYDRVFK